MFGFLMVIVVVFVVVFVVMFLVAFLVVFVYDSYKKLDSRTDHVPVRDFNFPT